LRQKYKPIFSFGHLWTIIISYKIIESIKNNLFIETIKNKLTKLKICKELFNVLGIKGLEGLNKDVISNFTKEIENKWLKENIETVKKVFEIRTNKYNDFTYYNIYLLLITVVKGLFDENMFDKTKKRLGNLEYYCYYMNDINYNKHKEIINLMNKNIDFLD
jgi:hypothetical protein